MLAVQIFLIVLLAQVIGWIGKTRLNALVSRGAHPIRFHELIGGRIRQAYTLFLSITRSPLQRRFVALRKELFKTKADLQSTSSQDEFAKWARLRRKMDKETAELEKLSQSFPSVPRQTERVLTDRLPQTRRSPALEPSSRRRSLR